MHSQKELEFAKLDSVLFWNDYSRAASLVDRLMHRKLEFVASHYSRLTHEQSAITMSLGSLNDDLLISFFSHPYVCADVYANNTSFERYREILSNIDAYRGIWPIFNYVENRNRQTEISLLPGNLKPRTPQSRLSYGQAINKVTSAFNSLKLLSPAAYSFSKKMINIIDLQHAPTLNSYSGSSNREILGRITLRNAHSPCVSESKLVSSIVHESIHIALYIVEQRTASIEDIASAPPELISPWSGRKLSTVAFVHSIFVWGSLYHLWKHKPFRYRYGDCTVDTEIDYIRNGFKCKTLSLQLEQLSRHINPTFWQLIDRILRSIE